MANKFRVNTLLLSGQAITASASNVYVNDLPIFVTTSSTGQAFYPRYGNPAGYLMAAQAGGVQSVIVTGQAMSGVITITGIGGVGVTYSGATMVVSGGSGPGGTYVDLVSNQTIGGMKIFTEDVRISGQDVDIDIQNSGLNHCILASGNVDDYYEINVMNFGSGTNSSADFVASITSNPNNNYTDMGINGPNYTGALIGNTGDGYLYHLGKDMYIGNATSGRYLIFFAGGNQTGLVGGEIIIDASGRMGIGKIPNAGFDVSGSGIFSDCVTIGTSLVLSAQSAEPNRKSIPTDLELFNKILANRAVPHVDNLLGNPYPLGPAIWGKHIQAILPGPGPATQPINTIGCGPTNIGTLTWATDQYYGYMANFATAATANAQAGTSISGASLYRPTGDLRSGSKNGFFFTSKFALPDATGAYITGLQGGSPNGFPTGVRVFVGLTDRTMTVTLNTNIPTGSRFGLSFVRSTGGNAVGQDDRNDNNWQIASCDNNLQVLTDTTIPFNSGAYQFFAFCPPAPNPGNIYWRLDDVSRLVSATGIVYNRLPIVGAPMRGAAGIQSLSGAKNIRIYTVYAEV